MAIAFYLSPLSLFLLLSVPLSQIQEVLRGRSTNSFKLHQTTSEDNCCFSICYNEGSSTKTLDLIAATPDEADLWINGLLALTFSGTHSLLHGL